MSLAHEPEHLARTVEAADRGVRERVGMSDALAALAAALRNEGGLVADVAAAPPYPPAWPPSASGSRVTRPR